MQALGRCTGMGANPRKVLSADGDIWGPNISPDNKRMVFTVNGATSGLSIVVSNISMVQTSVPSWPVANDGKYAAPDGPRTAGMLFSKIATRARSIFGQHKVQPGFCDASFHQFNLPMGLYPMGARSQARDGGKEFSLSVPSGAVNSSVMTLIQSSLFLYSPAFLLFDPTFSSDGKWVAYASYPDYTLWRSRTDGTDRLQLTDPPAS